MDLDNQTRLGSRSYGKKQYCTKRIRSLKTQVPLIAIVTDLQFDYYGRIDFKEKNIITLLEKRLQRKAATKDMDRYELDSLV